MRCLFFGKFFLVGLFLLINGQRLMAGDTYAVVLKCRGISLLEAVQQFGKITNFDLVYADDLLAGIEVNGTVRTQNPLEGLALLLKDSGISFRQASDNRMVLFLEDPSKHMTVSGKVMGLDRPLAGAAIAVGQGLRFAQTTPDGKFQLRNIPQQKLRLVISAEGFLDTSVDLEPSKNHHSLSVELFPKPLLAEQIVVSQPQQHLPSKRNLLVGDWLRQEDLAANGSGSRDIFQSLDTLPGVTTGLLEGGISIRGGRSSENLILLEGIKLYQLDHGLGYFSSINPDAIEVVTLFKGGYPAQYGDRLAGVLDISALSTKGQGLGLTAGVDRDLGHATVSVPIGNSASLMVSARQTHSDATIRAVSDRVFAATFNSDSAGELGAFGSNSRFGFEDQLLHLDWDLSADTFINLTAFHSQDKAKEDTSLNEDGFDFALFNKDSTWGNEGASFKFGHRWATDQQTTVSASRSQFESIFDFVEVSFTDDDFTAAKRYTTLRKNKLTETRFEVQHSVDLGEHRQLEMGVFTTDIRLKNDSFFLTETLAFEPDPERPILGVDLSQGEVTPGETGDFVSEELSRQNGLFFNVSGHVISRLRMNLGLRYREARQLNKNFLEPRASLSVPLNEQWNVNAFWGEFHQLALRSPDTINYFEGHTVWFLAQEYLSPGASEQYQVGVVYQKETARVQLDFYRKNQEGALLKAFNFLRPEEDLIQTRETYEGLDLGAAKHFAKLSLNLGYSYQDTFVKEDLITGKALGFPTSRDQPHSGFVMVSWHLPQWEFTGVYRAASGLPYSTPEIVFKEVNGEETIDVVETERRFDLRLPASRSLNLKASYRFPFRSSNLTFSLALTNALDHRNIAHRLFLLEDDDNELYPVDILDFGRRLTFDIHWRY